MIRQRAGAASVAAFCADLSYNHRRPTKDVTKFDIGPKVE